MHRLRPHAPQPLAAAVLAALNTLCAAASAQSTQPPPAQELPAVTVIGTTPLPGLGTPLRDVPANVQVFGAEIGKQRQGNVGEFLENNPTSVTVNAAQGNPYQPDISFRGFTASPLLGVPQGLSVFQDGVRINEPFGDVVNWDILPQSAIAGLQLIPGSNPVFGLNTLGGALSVITKSGSTNPGTSVEVSGGSFGRITAQFDHGGASGPMDWFTTANVSNDSGWAQHNPSHVRQLFGKVGYHAEQTSVELSLTAADNRLEGTQTIPLSFFDDRTQAYTYPDLNINEVAMLALKGSSALAPDVLLGGNAYVRRYVNDNVSSNVNDNFGEIDPVTGLPDDVQALNDRASINQSSYGLGMQLTLGQHFGAARNQLVFGASGDFGDIGFTQDEQPAQFDALRAAVPIGDFEPLTSARSTTRNLAAYVMDSLAFTPEWTLTLSGRFNHAEVSIRDRSGTAPGLNGDHGFSRFNPAVGLNFNPTTAVTAYATYNEGMRAPTAVELTCADPAAPCKLPNSFLADPPLKMIVARTVEAGARGRQGDVVWSAAVYRTDLIDDIQFVSSGGGINAGFFQNVGRTRRQGIELTAANRWGPLQLIGRYGLIDATYRTGFTENSPSNSSADANGDIRVQPGNQIPGIPMHTFRLRIDFEPSQTWSVGANMIVNSAIYSRGDENNQDVSGQVPGYMVVNLDGRYRASRNLELFARVNNLFNREYANFGILGENVFTGPNRSFDPANAQAESFRGLGAPRGAWVGLRYEWD
ncbi:MAG TPA: TonB-dependent receptor [Burkholderiaceae bacterium]|nr:TonB-dependent receptor [Burkholderiaceae bacterium]